MPQERKADQDTNKQDATQDAAAVVLEYERKRKLRAGRRARRRRREALRQHHAAMNRMRESIEVIKWCVLAISTVMVVSLIIGLMVLHEVENEVERVRGQVAEIQREAEVIREKIRHPMESVGALFGRQLDTKAGALFGGDQE